ncbi:MAG TPA: thioesterase family protein [Longimicrobiaceae bacterium]|nr:thioesterase family protein [Longimicrobiaceae bacterium]
MPRQDPHSRGDYAHFLTVPTRWMDNDAYGHVNNVVYYSYFDTVVNRYLIDAGVLELGRSPVVGLVVETGCQFFRPVAFPDTLQAGLRVAHVGTSSVRYEVGIFREGEETAAAQGHFVHVYVERGSNAPTPVPEPMRAALERIRVPAETDPVPG